MTHNWIWFSRIDRSLLWFSSIRLDGMYLIRNQPFYNRYVNCDLKQLTLIWNIEWNVCIKYAKHDWSENLCEAFSFLAAETVVGQGLSVIVHTPVAALMYIYIYTLLKSNNNKTNHNPTTGQKSNYVYIYKDIYQSNTHIAHSQSLTQQQSAY